MGGDGNGHRVRNTSKGLNAKNRGQKIGQKMCSGLLKSPARIISSCFSIVEIIIFEKSMQLLDFFNNLGLISFIRQRLLANGSLRYKIDFPYTYRYCFRAMDIMKK